MTFGEKLKQLRIKNEYSQEYLAEKLNVSRQAITKWENGNGMPDIENLKSIARFFDVTLDSLLLDEEEIETTDEAFCLNIAGIGCIIGLTLGWLLMDLIGTNMAGWGLGGGIIGGALGYGVLLVKKK